MRRTLFTILIALTPLARAADKPPSLPPAARNAFAYFAAHQDPSGGWGQKVLSNAIPRRRGVTSPDGSPLPRETLTPPTIIDTCLVTLAYLEAARFAAPGAPLPREARAAADLIHKSVQGVAPDKSTLGLASQMIEKYCYTRGLDQALALEVLLRARDRLADAAGRRDLDFTLNLILARIKAQQQTNGAWPGDGQLAYLSDALITRALLVAARNNLEVDAATLDRAKAASLRFLDPATGEIGDDSVHATYECALTLDLLYHVDQNARAIATTAARLAALPTATPDQSAAAARRAAESQSAHDALLLAQKQFLKKLFDKNKPPPARPRPGANPLDAPQAGNPLDPSSTADEHKRTVIPVPVTAFDAIAYFLLLESFQESTHPDARRVAQAITTGLAARQDRDGNWHDASIRRADLQDHYLTAWATRALLVPLPPAPPAPAAR
jgi:hypothetical protein